MDITNLVLDPKLYKSLRESDKPHYIVLIMGVKRVIFISKRLWDVLKKSYLSFMIYHAFSISIFF